MGTILVTSRLGEDYREDLEEVMFFNPKQNYAETAIRNCVEQYGVPEIIAEKGYLRIRLELFSIAQTLYLIDRTESEDILAGMIVYVRDRIEGMVILHVAIAESYIRMGPIITARLIWDLLSHVIESASHISGIKNINLVYGNFLGKGKSKLISIPVIRQSRRNNPSKKKSGKHPNESITCYDYQHFFDCPQRVISKTRNRIINRATTNTGLVMPI